MERIRVEVGNKTYNCQVAKTEEERKKGLQNVEYLPSDEGMLFIFDEEDTHEMWMKDCSLELDIIGINDDEEVNTVYKAIPNDETLIPFPNSKYILEVNTGSEIVEGDEFDVDDSDDLNKYTMKILAPDGSTQMFLQGGERIFRRGFTKQLIKWSKKAELVKDNKDKFTKICKRIGKMMFKELNAQDTRDPEYVQIPD